MSTANGSNSGKEFEAEVAKSAQALGLCYWKIPTATKPRSLGKRIVLIKLRESPYDGFIVHEGRHIAVELKSQAVDDKAWPITNLAPHQEEGLLKIVEEYGGLAYLLVNIRKSRVKKLGITKLVSNPRAWAFPMQHWRPFKAALGRKSIPLARFDEPPFIPIPRVRIEKTWHWDLTCLLDVTQVTTLSNADH